MKTTKGDPKAAWWGRLRAALGKGGLVGILVLGTVTAGALDLAWPRPAAARPDKPVINYDTHTATFTGDQHLGIASGVDFLIDDKGKIINIIQIKDLTKDIIPSPPLIAGIEMLYAGTKGKDGKGNIWHAGNGDPGNPGFDLTANYNGGSHTMNVPSFGCGIYLNSSGGSGGKGGTAGAAFGPGLGGNGGDGAHGGAVTLTSSGAMEAAAFGIYAVSKGGDGGKGGNGGSGISYGNGGKGGHGGPGSSVTVTNSSPINSGSSGITAISCGGQGGDGGFAYGTGAGVGGSGADAGSGGYVTVTNHGTITTQNKSAHGIDAENWGGSGGHGGTGAGAYGKGGDGGIGGKCWTVKVTNYRAITTSGKEAYGILALSHGGAGGDGGTGAGVYGKGGAAKGSGPGGQVSLSNSGNIETKNDNSRGIFAQSVGGFAGGGGAGGGLVAFGASGNSAGAGGAVGVTNTGNIATSGAGADALFAQSVGGGGGSGGAAGGLFTFGGSGNAGGQGGAVSLTNSGRLKTSQNKASGLFAQSIGGGGGDGGATVSASPVMSFAMGGKGGPGGKGGQVNVESSNTINTAGKDAPGIHAQSVGGGGGHGGWAVSAAASTFPSFSCAVALGGSGGDGGQGGAVGVQSSSAIATQGDNAYGILAESVGGGGGDGGFSVAASSEICAIAISLGGSGGKGGSAQKVEVDSSGDITTSGANAYGIMAQSVGGGGGAGGYSVSGALGQLGEVSFGFGGSGGSGGQGSQVSVDNRGHIITSGKNAYGVLAQSLGGGGGAGGCNVNASIGVVSTSIGLGGKGGAGGYSDSVAVTNRGDISTSGELAHGLLAQSVGGGGGAGGYSISASAGVGALDFALGGSGKTGGHGGMVTLDNFGALTTNGVGAYGILAQSLGGGGGHGGMAQTYALSFGIKVGDVTIPAVSCSVSVGGKGGKGGDGQKVTVNNSGNITTLGGLAPVTAATDDVVPVDNSACYGILAQSVGGGGGDAGQSTAMALSITQGAPSASISVAVGGSGGSGGKGGQVEVTNTGAISTTTDNSIGIFAQSVGGGGGNGGLSRATAGGFQLPKGEKKPALQASVSVGGSGGGGGDADQVTVNDSGSINTAGNNATGILAQSVGGGGGKGGYSLAGAFSLAQTLKLAAAVGGSGGVAGNGGAVKIAKSGGAITTKGDFAPGIQAQSIGGGGGNGSWSVAGTVGNLNPKSSDRTNISVSGSVGGFGGAGGKGGAVTVSNKTDSSKNVEAADIFTQGTSSYGIFAQSVGGGGGNGGMSFDAALSSEAGKGGQTEWYGGVDLQVGASVGGFGGKGNDGGIANVDNDGNITTAGYKAHGIFAQSVGGGGGVGGDSAIFNYTLPSKGTPEIPDVGWNLSLEANVGGTGGAAGQGSKVTVKNTGKIVTQGDDACGIFAQSVGGGGGTGGNCISFPYLPLPSGKTLQSLFTSFFNVLKPSVFVGGAGGASGKGGDVTVDNRGDITTMGGVLATDKNDHSVIGAHGIFAQSVGGGGGTGGNANIGYKFGRIGFGGEGGSSGDGGQVTVTNRGNISTQGQGGCGIYAQSVGGGGGIAGNIVRSFFNFSGDKVPFLTYFGLGTGIGLAGGAGGNGGQVTVTSTGNIATLGDGAFGIFAQSVGGGGGTGGIDTAYASVGPGKLLFNGSTFHGADGNGGPVSISQTGTITTEGDYAHGIVAQSTSGKGKAGKVDVTLNGKIIANGIGSHGIQAQSLGAGSSNTINVTIKEGSTVQGGSDTASVAPSIYSYGVLFMDGSANTLAGGGGNTLNNYGFIHTLSGIDGTAVMQQANFGAPNWGDLTINNSGTITGSINQCTQVLTDDSKQLAEGMSLPTGFSTITFNNNPGAVFNTGSIINLGSGTLTNGGTLNLRGGGAGQSNLTGNFIQTSSGIFQTILNGDGTCGSLKVSGTATLAGTLKGLLGSGVFTNGTQYTVLQASNPITTKFTTEDLPHTSLVSFSTVYLNKALEVVSNVQSFTEVARNPHHWQLGQYLDTLLSAPAQLTGEFSGALGEFQTTEESNYPKIFESLSPGVYDADTITTFSITRQYVRTLQQRLQVVRENLRSPEMKSQAQASQPVLLAFNGSDQELGQFLGRRQEAVLYRRLGVWLQGFGQWGSQDGVDGFSGYDYNLAGTAAGLDYALTERLVVGANFGYGYTKINQDNNFGSGDINSLYGSLYGTYFGERAYLEGVLSYGHHKYRNNRLISIGPLQRVAESNHTGNSFFLFMEGGYSWPVQNWTLQPFGSLFYTYLDEGGFQESGAAGLDMQVDARQTNSVVSEMGLRLARPIKTSKGTLIPEVKAAWQHDFAVSKRTLPISFAGAPLGLAIDGRNLSQDGAVVSAGLSFTSKGGVTTSIKYDAELRGGYQAQAVIGQIRLSF